MPVTDLQLLIEAAQSAGDIALGYYRSNENQSWDKPDGQGPVTEADLAVDAHLRETLTDARTDFGWLSEETEDDPARLDTQAQFIVDPIDGTRAFMNGSKDWGHSIAIARNGEVTAAVVYMPAAGALYSAEKGRGAFLNGAPIEIAATIDPPTVLTARITMEAQNWRNGQPPTLTRHFRSSLAYRLCLVAQGRFSSMITLRASWEWDIAAGALIVSEAGGRLTDRTGGALRFNNAHPQLNGVVAGEAQVHNLILNHLP